MRSALAIVAITLLSPPLLAQEKFFDSNGVKIHFVEKGSGEPVVLVHGLGGSTATWSEFGVMDKLAQKYHVIAFDCRAHGLSGKPHDSSQYGLEMALDVVRLLDHLRIPKAHVVGYSMGGRLTNLILSVRPERFATATIAGATGPFEWTAADDQAIEIQAKEYEKEGFSRTITLRLADPHAPQPSEEDFKKRSAAALANPNFDRFAVAAMMRAARRTMIDPQKAAAVTVPTLAIVGSNDRSNLPDFETFKKLRPSIKLDVIDGATHGGEKGVRGRPEFITALMELIDAHPATK